MNNTVISNILEHIPDTSDVTINYYVTPTINNYYYDGATLGAESNTKVSNNSMQPQTNTIETQTSPQEDEFEEIDITISTDNFDTSIYNRSNTTPYTTQINATIDYHSDLDNINNVMDLTDALTASIANSLENMNQLDPQNISTEEMLEKTSLIIYKNIENTDEKCHICNEKYEEFDICRKNNLCSHYFHNKCIDKWYSRNIKCPICQQII